MFCQYCGVALSKQMKYCTHCGAQLIATIDAAEVEPLEQQMDRSYEWLVRLAIWGLAMILGGMILMKKFQLSTGLIVAYMILSSLVFLILFGLSLCGLLDLAGRTKEADGAAQIGQLDTNELNPADAQTTIEAVSSVTESATRKLEPASTPPISSSPR